MLDYSPTSTHSDIRSVNFSSMTTKKKCFSEKAITTKNKIKQNKKKRNKNQTIDYMYLTRL
jgi:hypothetical protein